MVHILDLVRQKDDANSLYTRKLYVSANLRYTEIIDQITSGKKIEGDQSAIIDLHFMCLSNRCACFLQTNELELALADAKVCVKLRPEWIKGYLRLGNCYARMGEKRSARVAYEQVLSIQPNQREAIEAIAALDSPTISSIPRSDGSNRSGSTTNSSPNIDISFQKLKRQMKTYLNQGLTWLLHNTSFAFFCACLLLVYYGMFSEAYAFHYGLSWPAWFGVVGAAYWGPPLFEEWLGPHFARPFFGMSFTTFVWLLQLLGNQHYGNRRNRYR